MKEDSSFNVQVLPTFRPDRALNIEKADFADYIRKLSEAASVDINSFETLVEALEIRARYFKEVGCKLSDQAFSNPDFSKGTLAQARTALDKALKGDTPDEEEINAYKTHLCLLLADLSQAWICNAASSWCNTEYQQQNGSKVRTGYSFDSIGDSVSANSLAALLDGLEDR